MHPRLHLLLTNEKSRCVKTIYKYSGVAPAFVLNQSKNMLDEMTNQKYVHGTSLNRILRGFLQRSAGWGANDDAVRFAKGGRECVSDLGNRI